MCVCVCVYMCTVVYIHVPDYGCGLYHSTLSALLATTVMCVQL